MSAMAAGNEIVDILNRLDKKEFSITLHCPECSSLIKDFLCPRCGAKVDKSSAAVSKVFFSVSMLLSLCFPLFGAAVGILVTRSFVGAVVGLVIGQVIAMAGRGMEARANQAVRASVADDLHLAKQYQGAQATFDAAAFCYLHWLRTQRFPLPPIEMAAFLWQYRFSSKVDNELRQTLLDTLFYALCRVVDHYGAGRKADHATLLLAAANDSPEQIELGTQIALYSNQGAVMADLLAQSAPLTSAALLGKPVEGGAVGPVSDSCKVYILGGRWPARLMSFDLPQEEEKGVRLICQNDDRFLGMTTDKIMLGKIVQGVSRVQVHCSIPLEQVEKIIEEWAADRSEFKGTWLFTKDRAIHIDAMLGLPRLFEILGISFKNALTLDVSTPQNQWLLRIGKWGALLCLSAMGVGVLMIIAGHGKVNMRGGIASYGLGMVSIPFIPLLNFLPVWTAGCKGSTKAFLAACVPDMAHREKL